MSKEFIWTDELVKEFAKGVINVQNSIPHDVSIEIGMYHFKKSKGFYEDYISSKQLLEAESAAFYAGKLCSYSTFLDYKKDNK